MPTIWLACSALALASAGVLVVHRRRHDELAPTIRAFADFRHALDDTIHPLTTLSRRHRRRST
jgi:hypothetical protein